MYSGKILEELVPGHALALGWNQVQFDDTPGRCLDYMLYTRHKSSDELHSSLFLVNPAII